MKRVLPFLLIFISSLLNAQPGQIDCHFADYGQFVREYNGNPITTNAIDFYESGTHAGKFVTASYERAVSSGNRRFVVHRYNSDGTLDNTFGTSGALAIDFGFSTGNQVAEGIAVLNNDKIVVVGHDYISSQGRVGVVALITSAGALDTGFDGDGKLSFANGTFTVRSTYFYDVAGLSDGTFAIAYRFDESTTVDGYVAKYNQSGTQLFNTSINWNPSTTSYFEAAECIAVDASDNIFVGGWSGNSTASSAIAKLSSSGVLDATFGTGGKVVFDIDATETAEGLTDIEPLSGGSLILASNGRPSAIESFNVVKMSSTGTLDNTFDSDGVYSWAGTTSGDYEITGVEIQSDGKIVAFGYADPTGNVDDFVALRLSSTGVLDATYGTSGIKYWDLENNSVDKAYDGHLNNTGKLVMVGSVGASSSSHKAAAAFFNDASETQTICDGLAFQDTVPASVGDESTILRVVIWADGDLTPYSVTNMQFNTTGTTSTADISSAKLYYTGNSASYASTTQYGSTVSSPSGTFNFTQTQALSGGPNYFWLVYDVPSGATVGNQLDAQFTQFTLTTLGVQTPAVTNPSGVTEIIDPFSPKLYWTDSGTGFDHLVRADSSGSNSGALLTGLNNPRWLAIDMTNEKIFYIDATSDIIYYSDFDGSNYAAWKTGFTQLGGIVIDNTRDKVYYSDNATGIEAVYQADLDGSNATTLFSGSTNTIAQMTMDEANNVLYLIDGSNDNIYKYDIGSSTFSTFKSLTGGSPDGLFYDSVSDFLYWSDDATGFDHIKKIKTDGTGEAFVHSSLNSPKGIWVYDGHIYWSDSGDDKIYKSKVNGTQRKAIYTATSTSSTIWSVLLKPQTTPPSVPVAIAITNNTGVSCSGGNDGSVTATATPGVANYSYSWSNGSTTTGTTSLTNTISGLVSGTYTVTVTDGNGTTATASAFVSSPTAVSATATATSNVSCNGLSDGVATGSASGGTSPYTYSWSNGITVASNTGLTTGTYTVTVTDANGCTDADAVFISEPTAISATATVGSNVSCNGGGDGQLNGSASGGTSPYTYSWSNGLTTQNATSLAAGTYTVTVTDANGCTDVTSNSISQPTALVASASVTGTLDCNSDTDGEITASQSGGTSPYTYSWNTGETNAIENNIGAGTYSVTITDANGCTDSASVLLSQPVVLVASASKTDVSTNGGNDGTVIASASGGTGAYSYSWNTGATTATETNLVAGTYSVTITDANGCTDSASVLVAEPLCPTITASTVVDSNVSCNGFLDGGATASATGGASPYTYSWSNSATTASITGVAAGTYTVTVTDNNGCTSGASSVTITEPANLSASTVVDSNVSCNGFLDGGATASATGGTSPYTYSWSNSATTASITGVASGTYTVSVTDNNGCGPSTSSVTITQPVSLSATSTSSTNVSCNGGNDGSVSTSASGGTSPYTYNWSNAGTTSSITNLTVGTYTVTITDANGCTTTTSRTLTEPSMMTTSVAIDSNVTCNGFLNGGATASTTGGVAPYTYAWSNSATTASITGIAANTYTVTVTDNNGCTNTSSITITEPTALIASTVVDSNLLCNGIFTGGATASASGGVIPYTFSWSNGATTASITGLSAVTYTVTVTDNNGCTSTQTATITGPTMLLITPVVDNNVSCNGLSDGAISTTTTGGVAPYSYFWSNSDTTSSITGLTAGTYFVTLTDNNGCTQKSTATVTEPAVLVATSVLDSNVRCNGALEGGSTASATGGTTPYTYNWSNSAITASITGVAAGTYTVTITDNNGCTDTASTVITEPTALDPIIATDSNVSCNGFSDGGASVSVTGGTGAYTYEWSNNATTSAITGVTAGTYTLTVSDANGCFVVLQDTIEEPSLIRPRLAIDSNVSCFGLADGGLSTDAVGGVGPYTYAWSNGDTTSTSTGLIAGIYTVTVTDSIGCSVIASDTITEPNLLVASTVLDSNVKCFFGNDGGASASATGGTIPYTYSWSNGFVNSRIVGISAGIYTVTITDANGCTDSSSVSVSEPTELIASPVVDSTVSCRGGSDGGASASVTGGTTPYSYAWSTTATTQSITGLSSGSYSVTVTDGNGCTTSTFVFVSQPSQLNATTTLDSNVSCLGFANGGASASGSGGTSPYTYSWSNGGTTASITGVVAGTYTVTVTDNNGCTDNASITITEPSTAVSTAVVVDSNATCFDALDGGASASGSGGTSPYNYLWSNGATTSSVNGIGAGTYTVTVTDNNGCTISDSVVITEPALLTRREMDTACVQYTWAQNGRTYFSTGTFADTILNPVGCDSVIYLDLIIHPVTSSSMDITACDIYTWPTNGTTYTMSGNFSAVLTNAAGCDSIVALNLTVNRSTDTTMVMQACNSFTWPQNGLTYTMSGMYQDTIMNAVGCDSVITLDLTLDTSTSASFTRLSCDTIYVWLGDTLTQAGMYLDTIMNAAGCDSIVTLDLSFGAPSSRMDTVTACDGYVWRGMTFDSSGVYLDTMTNASGCDSLLTLNLTINRSSMRMDTVISCDSYLWMRDTLVDTLMSSGIYRDTLVNTVGCDSIMVLDLTINQMTMATVRDTACDSYTWSLNNQTYDTTGSYVYVISGGNASGCDSVVTLELVINNSDVSTSMVTSCFNYTWPQTGVTYTKSGVFADTLTNAANCDSILVLDLTINDVDVSISKRQSDLTANQGGASYQWIDCDADTALTGETGQTFRAFKNGNYKVVVTINGCVDTSLCVPVTGVGLGEFELPETAFMVMPNPTSGYLTVRLEGVQADGDRIMIYSMKGEIVHEEVLLMNGQELDLSNLSDGLYMIRYKNIMKKVVVSK